MPAGTTTGRPPREPHPGGRSVNRWPRPGPPPLDDSQRPASHPPGDEHIPGVVVTPTSMRPTLLTGSALLALSVLGCAPSPDEVCRKMVDQLCDRSFACRTDTDTATFKNVFGDSAADCKTKYYAVNDCASRTEESQNCVGYNAGRSQFSTTNFFECQNALNSLDCDAYLDQQIDPRKAPTVCKEVCE